MAFERHVLTVDKTIHRRLERESSWLKLKLLNSEWTRMSWMTALRVMPRTAVDDFLERHAAHPLWMMWGKLMSASDRFGFAKRDVYVTYSSV